MERCDGAEMHSVASKPRPNDGGSVAGDLSVRDQKLPKKRPHPDTGPLASAGAERESGPGAVPTAVVILVDKSVRASDTRRRLAQERAKAKGNFLVLSAPSPEQCPHPGTAVTHLVLGHSVLAEGPARQATRQRLRPYLARWPGMLLLDEAWLTQLMREQRLPLTGGFEVILDQDVSAGVGSGAAGPLAASSTGPRMPPAEAKYERWLGRWSQELDGLDDASIMLQAVFNEKRCAKIGNSAIVSGLHELEKYETAVREHDDEVAIRGLAYARAAAAVQACAFRITSSMSDAFLVRHLPYVNLSCAQIIQQLAESSERLAGANNGTAAAVPSPGRSAGTSTTDGGDGDGGSVTCERLELFRQDLPVRDGDGVLRRDSAGAASRRRLSKLSFVGSITAKLWYEKGCRTLDDALAMMRSGTLQPPSATVAWALEHHEQLTAGVAPNEVAEMVGAVEAALAAVTPHMHGWVVQLVGGARRGRASHDVDLIVSHPAVGDQDEMGEHFDTCVKQLMESGHLLPKEGNCTRLHRYDVRRYHQQVFKSLADGDQGDKVKRRGVSDGLHYVFGVFVTSSGHLKRLDLLFCCWPWMPHALLGWTGSSQFLRFLHQHAASMGFRRTNHALYNLRTRQPVSGIQKEADIFKALRLPYREPEDRQCP